MMSMLASLLAGLFPTTLLPGPAVWPADGASAAVMWNAAPALVTAPRPGPGPSPATPGPDAGSAAGEGVGVVVFNNVEEATRAEPGTWYVEAAFTLARRVPGDRHSTSLLFQPGIYHSPSETLTLGLFPADVSYTSSGNFDGLRYEGSAAQALLSLVDPESSPLGLAVFAFAGGNERGIVGEGRLVIQRLHGPWNLTYNLRLSTAVEGIDGGGTDTTGTLGHSFGVACSGQVADELLSELVSAWSLGGELLIDSRYHEWRRYVGTTVYSGPTLGLVLGRTTALTVTGLVQLTDEDAPRWTLQVTLGWGF